ncbi:MAG: IS256 family transposase [Pyrinomonadaceae bacterium]
MKETNRKQTRVKGTADRRVVEFFVKHGQFLLPMIDLVEQSSVAIDELIDVVGRGAVEAVLQLSAQELSGAKSQGRRVRRAQDLRWHGRQWGSVALSDRKLRVERPRLRGEAGEVAIPAYAALQDDDRMSARMLELLLSGVSTRDYQKVIREMAETVGVSKSSVSREFVEESATKLKELNERSLADQDLLIVYLDGMVYGEHHVLGAIGVDRKGFKHALGMRLGSSENAVVAKDLLAELVARGLDPEVMRLYVLDGSKALRKAVKEVFGDYAVVQRCRTHKLRNVLSYLPQHLQDQVAAVIRAAYKLPYKEGLARLKTQAAWLQKEHPQAAGSLLEGLEETFTVNRLGLTVTLMKCLTTTNIIENPNGTVRRQTRRVSRWQDGAMVLRWAASAFLNAESKFRRVSGYRELWMLENALKTLLIDNQPVAQLANQEKAA